MIVVHGETLWSPAPQPMDDDDDAGGLFCVQSNKILTPWSYDNGGSLLVFSYFLHFLKMVILELRYSGTEPSPHAYA